MLTSFIFDNVMLKEKLNWEHNSVREKINLMYYQISLHFFPSSLVGSKQQIDSSGSCFASFND